MIRKIRRGFLDAKRPVNVFLGDEHVVNEQHAVRKSHDAIQKKMSFRGAFQCTT